MHPRWAPDSSTLIYFTPGQTRVGRWHALGDQCARRVAATHHQRKRRRRHQPRRSADRTTAAGGFSARAGRRVQRRIAAPSVSRCCRPMFYTFLRWAPDDRAIAFQRLRHAGFNGWIEVYDLERGELREVASGTLLGGLSWLPDGSGFVYGSSRSGTLLYPPTFNLRSVRARRQRRSTAHVRRSVLRRARRARVGQAGRRPGHQPVRHLEDPVSGNAGGEHQRRRSRDETDRTGSGAVSQPRRSRGGVRIGHGWAHQPLDRDGPMAPAHVQSPSKRIPTCRLGCRSGHRVEM